MSARSVGSRGWGRPARYAASAAIALLVGSTMVGGCGTEAPAPTATSEAGMEPASSAPAYVRLDRGAHPLARPEVDVGPLDPGKRIDNLSILFKLSPKQVRDRDALLADLIDAGSPRYHQWLTPTDYAARFGARPEDIARVTAWLAQQGLEVHDVSPLGARVTFSGTVASSRPPSRPRCTATRSAARRTTRWRRRPRSPPSCPTSCSASTTRTTSTEQHVKPELVRTSPAATCPGGDGYCAGNGIAPPDWAAIYDVNPLYNPGHRRHENQRHRRDHRHRRHRRDRAERHQRVPDALRPAGLHGHDDSGPEHRRRAAGRERRGHRGLLDTEWAGGIAPDANVNYYFNGANDPNIDDAVYYAIEQNRSRSSARATPAASSARHRPTPTCCRCSAPPRTCWASRTWPPRATPARPLARTSASRGCT